jgi:hypothetical protein
MLMSGPVPLLTILITYLYFSSSAGPRWMKDRKPFDLKYVLMVYNVLQVAFSVWLVHEVRHTVSPPQGLFLALLAFPFLSQTPSCLSTTVDLYFELGFFLESKGFWRRCITLEVTGFLDFVHFPEF